jgi:hypothetical protein
LTATEELRLDGLLKDLLPLGDEDRERYCAVRLFAAYTDGRKDATGNLEGLRGNPHTLLCAHMDVHPEGIGYDDCAGVAIILAAAELLPDVAFLLTVGEEDGRRGAKAWQPNSCFDGIERCVLFDRFGGGQCVHKSGWIEYAKPSVAHAICDELKAGGLTYNPCAGGTGDAVELRHFWPTVNLSVGFDKEHTREETLDRVAWHKAWKAAVILSRRRDG